MKPNPQKEFCKMSNIVELEQNKDKDNVVHKQKKMLKRSRGNGHVELYSLNKYS